MIPLKRNIRLDKVNLRLVQTDKGEDDEMMTDKEVMTILRRLHSVSVSYPPDLEQLINAFKLCATVRLFLQVNLAG